MKLSGNEIKELRIAIIDAFPNLHSLKRLIRESDLNINLEEIVFGENLNHVVSEIIDWTEAHNKLDILINAAYEANPDNPKLKAFVQKRQNPNHPTLQEDLKRGEIVSQSKFDVFLCHNSQDKPEVEKIAHQLIESNIKLWLDKWQLRPGLAWQPELEKQIENIKSVAVFVGDSGLGPWQKQEIYAFLQEFVNRGCPVIPVLLPTAAPEKPQLPVFLRGHTWVDFGQSQHEAIKNLIWGITGINPND